ncbi:MAG: hypothetical protein ACN6PB_03960 [Achromobacter kerstersii]|uniref:hypothetical protein n=2 Tax=Achromobacter kerstersii TaxID=1353890 RepID=UPI003D081A28
MTAPSLLSASAPARGEAESSRILAALEGRAPEAEVKHLATPREGRARRWVALAVLLALMAGGISWIIHEDGAAPMVAQAPAPAVASASNPVASLPQASMPSPSSPSGELAIKPMDRPPDVAAIIDEAPPARDAGVGRGEPEPQNEPTNPLSMLAMTTPPAAGTPAAGTPAAGSPAAAPGPTRQAAEQRAQHANAPRAAKPASTPPRKTAKPSDTDAALLSALMNYGLPPASPPGTRVYKSEGVFMREMPGSPLSERLKECRKLSFIEGEQCRLRVCAGQWGTAPECPTPQANVEP